MQGVQGSPGDAGCHVHADYVANILWDYAEAIEDRQSHHGTVHLTFQLDLLLAPSHTGPFGKPNFAGCDQRAEDGEQRRQTEVATKVPPEACAVIG